MMEAGIEEARKDLGGIVDRARYKGEHTVITRTGKGAAVIVPVEWYEEQPGGESAVSFNDGPH